MKKRKIIYLFVLLLYTVLISAAFSLTRNTPSLPGEIQSEEQWFFKAISGYPVSVTFEPVVLFENGEYLEVGITPTASLNIEKSKMERPKAWGTWKKENNTFYLTNYKGKTYDYRLGSGNWFPAFPYNHDIQLARSYKNTSSTDVGSATTLAISKISFIDNQHFVEGNNIGTIAPASAAWKKNKHTGTYTIQGHTLILSFADGRQEERSFALGASGNPAKPDTKMIFIGGDAYLAEK
ncbi:hypothetical protein ED312_09595 [Sinomicrobium pectinilyticum]|uniref:Uncharacterized protein n=1 Tax=Sinomicrobium pectinilyticum TaxID=1084421 RepID=A0A3N0EJ10_SINP1|nr:hypothetical protein [Sinomicrobium pectinilyticum]RNL87870.1 hypothetical protein ED312_09595 [Sinomicrobium pectinilyticum]